MDPSNFHKTAPITEEEFEIGGLKPLSCSVEAISDAIVKFLTPLYRSNCHGASPPTDSTTTHPPSRRDKAIQRFRNRGTWHRGAWSEDPKSQLEDLKLFFDIFNDVFFNGLLKGLCQFELLSSSNMQDRVGRPCVGCCYTTVPGTERDKRYRIEKPWALLSIREQDSHETRWRSRGFLLKEYLGTLLHEMLHAMFTLYTCWCFSGCYQKGRKLRLIGHHMEWQRAAHAIELVDLEWMGIPGLKLDMWRDLSLAHDMLLGYSLPNDAVLRSAHVDIAMTRKMLQLTREDNVNAIKSASHRSMTPWVPLKSNRCLAGESTVDEYGSRFGYDRTRWPKRAVQEPPRLPKEVTDSWSKSRPPASWEEVRHLFEKNPKKDGCFCDNATLYDYGLYLGFVDFQRLQGFKPF